MGNKLQYYYNRMGCFQLNYWSCLNLRCYTVEPRLIEEQREWQNVFAITRSFFIHFTITGVKQIVSYTKDFLIQVFVISRFHCSTKGKQNLSATCAIWLAKWQWWYFYFLSLSAICLFSNFFRISHLRPSRIEFPFLLAEVRGR